jgi:phosphodiesterase/alkaline phosphatase D-like protein
MDEPDAAPERDGRSNNDPLVLGPVLRYVDETSAVIWVEVDRPTVVSVKAGGRTYANPTFCVHGHSYAMVDVDGLTPGDSLPYEVFIGDDRVWPHVSSSFPPSRIRTLDPARDPRLLYGSCRTSVSHDAEGNAGHGVDALRAYAIRLHDEPEDRWPDLVLFLGDQVYADETSDAMREFISSRRDTDEGSGEELADYAEYAHLYSLAWADPANRWLLSTVPSAMIFDDHDVRDDWNTSQAWRDKMAVVPWWPRRISAALASYWVYQHLGNLSPEERRADELWQAVSGMHSGADAGDLLDRFALRADAEPTEYRWSHARRLGDTRLVVIDTRAARVLRDGQRAMLDPAEMKWLGEQMRGDCEHLVIGSSLPYLMPVGLHHAEAWDEALAQGSWGERWRPVGEKIRQGADLEHWAAFQQSFQDVAAMVLEVAEGKRGTPPATVIFLGGDVHHSYLSEVDLHDRPVVSRVLQAVCSPIRNPLPRAVRIGLGLASAKWAWNFIRLARSAKVPDPPFRWNVVEGPWFDNNIATLAVRGRALDLFWERGVVRNDEFDSPDVETVRAVRIG